MKYSCDTKLTSFMAETAVQNTAKRLQQWVGLPGSTTSITIPTSMQKTGT